MTNPLVSVVVPVYNSHRHLCRCVDSILAQTYRNFEILLIDDGSVDQSGKICENYAESNDRVRFLKKENGGVSSARNFGIENSLGEYICFVDSDDRVDKDYLHLLLQNIECADISIGAYAVYKGDADGSMVFSVKDKKYTLSRFKADIASIYSAVYINTPCNKLFKKEIIEKNHLRFPVGIAMGEDCIFVLSYLDVCRKINCFSKVIYNYYYDPAGKYRHSFLSDRLVMLDKQRQFFASVTDYRKNALILQGYLAAFSEDIVNIPSDESDGARLERFIKENKVDELIKKIKVPFYKKILAYRWLILLEKGRYSQYAKEYITH